jgi:hypothetical protein
MHELEGSPVEVIARTLGVTVSDGALALVEGSPSTGRGDPR